MTIIRQSLLEKMKAGKVVGIKAKLRSKNDQLDVNSSDALQ